MNKIEILREVADETESKFTSTYSGRGMYGKQCCGITTDDPYKICLLLGSKGLDPETDIRVDNMGLSTIIYFPRIQLTKDVEFDEDGDCKC